ncbi:MAG TPA: hypothetical protein DEQ20_11410, partial [Desulfobulbaceae bacterium]|nr:hypothetical protein [Desulfobulbaceae bacterium]
MYRNFFLAVFFIIAVSMFISIVPQESQARAGGGRSMGSRGTRSYSMPAARPSQSSPYLQGTAQQGSSLFQV